MKAEAATFAGFSNGLAVLVAFTGEPSAVVDMPMAGLSSVSDAACPAFCAGGYFARLGLLLP